MWTVWALISAVAAVLLLVPARSGVARLEEPRTWSLPGWVRGRPGSLSAKPRGIVAAGCAIAPLALLGLSPTGVALAVIAGPCAFVGLGFLDVGQEQRRRMQLALELPASLDLLAACLAAGAPIAAATRCVAAVAPEPVAAELRVIVARTDIGESDEAAWRASAARPVIGPVARDVARAASSGTALVASLRRHAEEGRRARHATLEGRAKSVGISAVVPMSVCFLPAFVLVGIVPIIASVAFRLLG